jgi:hypothetical protein
VRKPEGRSHRLSTRKEISTPAGVAETDFRPQMIPSLNSIENSEEPKIAFPRAIT